jgi:hypothetical protein
MTEKKSIKQNFKNDLNFAKELDHKDGLRNYRERF